MPEYDDLDRRDGGRDDRGGGGGDVIERAKARVKVPAVGLIISGILALLAAGYGLATMGSLDSQIAAELKKVDDNAALSAEQKKEQKEMMTKVFDVIKVVVLPANIANLAMALVMVLGGVKMMSLSGKGLTILAAVLGMITCMTGCCVTGFIFGIWALVTINNPEVKAGYAAVARGGGGYDG